MAHWYNSPARREQLVASADQLITARPVVEAVIPQPPPPPPPVVAVAVVEPLPDLATAQAAMKATAAAAREAAELAEKAAVAVVEASERKAALADVAARAVSLGAERIRKGHDKPLPGSILDARKALFDAELDLQDANLVCELLTGEHKAAALEADVARDRVARAIDAKMQAHALDLIVRMREAECEAGRLRVLALGVCAARPINGVAPAWAITSIGYDGHSGMMLEISGDAWRSAPALWTEFQSALLLNPDAIGPA